MRKKVISATFAIALATVAGYGIYNAQNKVVLSDSAKANVEALASEETVLGGYTQVSNRCPDPFWWKRSTTCIKGGSDDCVGSDCF